MLALVTVCLRELTSATILATKTTCVVIYLAIYCVSCK